MDTVDESSQVSTIACRLYRTPVHYNVHYLCNVDNTPSPGSWCFWSTLISPSQEIIRKFFLIRVKGRSGPCVIERDLVLHYQVISSLHKSVHEGKLKSSPLLCSASYCLVLYSSVQSFYSTQEKLLTSSVNLFPTSSSMSTPDSFKKFES